MSNCEFYIETTTDDFRCLKCEFGFTSTISLEGREGILNDCRSDADCSNSKYLGLDLIWSKYFSCH